MAFHCQTNFYQSPPSLEPLLTTPTQPPNTPNNTLNYKVEISFQNKEKTSFIVFHKAPYTGYSTFNSLVNDFANIAKNYDIQKFALYYKKSPKGNKYIIENENDFENVNFNDPNLIFVLISESQNKKRDSNAIGIDSILRAKKPKIASQYEKDNNKIQESRVFLELNLPQSVQKKMSNKDWIKYSYCHGRFPDKFNIIEISRLVNNKSSLLNNDCNDLNNDNNNNNNGSNKTKLQALRDEVVLLKMDLNGLKMQMYKLEKEFHCYVQRNNNNNNKAFADINDEDELGENDNNECDEIVDVDKYFDF